MKKSNKTNTSPTWVKTYGHVTNKKFRYYKDRTMTELKGVFDFDKVNCLIMIDDGEDENKKYF
jgi:hypothetical protein